MRRGNFVMYFGKLNSMAINRPVTELDNRCRLEVHSDTFYMILFISFQPLRPMD